MESDDQAYLNQIEQNIRSKDNDQDDARKEAEQRSMEMARIRQATSNSALPGLKPSSAQPPAKPNELEGDPRYREYFERLKKQKGISTPSGGVPGIAHETPAAGVARATVSENQVVGPGSIVRFDDGSIGIYKDAVSGRDYALFYFLQPDGQFNPEGVFLQCYQAKAIGILPENYFSKLRDDNTWDRDLILYHLSNFDHIGYLNNLAEHEERKPKNTTPARNPAISSLTTTEPSAPSSRATSKPVGEGSSSLPVSESEKASGKGTTQPLAVGSDELVRGRKFMIKFSGKEWEAVYWSKDSEGTIVAHSTHGHWSLMRLDLDRFKDSLELGEVVDSTTMNTIAEDVAAAK